jgi:4a-hydroxytetrahydrobiopterin dehydratase
MKLFSKILENKNKNYIAEANLRIKISAENEGEAGYIADFILGGIEETEEYEILNISELSPMNENSWPNTISSGINEPFPDKEWNNRNSNWSEVGGYLQRSFQFGSFKESIDFVNKVYSLSEEEKHHPDIEISESKVVIKLKTKDEDKITDRDRIFSKKIDSI